LPRAIRPTGRRQSRPPVSRVPGPASSWPRFMAR
jgi:hypothetical protein